MPASYQGFITDAATSVAAAGYPEFPWIRRADIEVITPTMQFGLSRPGMCRCKVPLGQISVSTCEPGYSALWITRNGKIVWTGIIWEVSRSEGASFYDLSAEEWPSYFQRRYLTDTIYAGNNVATGAMTIVANILATTGMNDVGVLVEAAGGATYTPIWYGFENRNVYDTIQNLSTVGGSSGGFEWVQRIREYNGTTITVTQPVWAFSSPWSGNYTLHDLSLETGPGTRNNAQISFALSGRRANSSVIATGFGTRSQQLRSTASNFRKPNLTTIVSDPELGRSGGFTVVSDRAKDTLNRTLSPNYQLKAKVRTGDLNEYPDVFPFGVSGAGSIIEPGNNIYIKMTEPFFSLPLTLMRIVDLTLSVDAFGQEWYEFELGKYDYPN